MVLAISSLYYDTRMVLGAAMITATVGGPARLTDEFPSVYTLYR